MHTSSQSIVQNAPLLLVRRSRCGTRKLWHLSNQQQKMLANVFLTPCKFVKRGEYQVGSLFSSHNTFSVLFTCITVFTGPIFDQAVHLRQESKITSMSLCSFRRLFSSTLQGIPRVYVRIGQYRECCPLRAELFCTVIRVIELLSSELSNVVATTKHRNRLPDLRTSRYSFSACTYHGRPALMAKKNYYSSTKDVLFASKKLCFLPSVAYSNAPPRSYSISEYDYIFA